MQLSQTIDIAGRQVGGDAPCYIIAEAGVSHFGDYQKALKLVDMAVSARADAVKFQVFDIDQMIAADSPEWKDRLGGRALPYEDFKQIQDYCRHKGITFFATAHDDQSLAFLDSIEVPVFKIGSGEVNNTGYLAQVAGYGRPVIYSTGMHGLEDVRRGLETMVGQGNQDIAVLHCVTQYPTPPEDVNLRAMDLLAAEFSCIVGYSDHTEGHLVPLAAVARGAKIIEKHITLEFNIPNAQDWKVSCGPEDLADFVSEIRRIESALGQAVKQPGEAEARNLAWARKSLVTTRAIPAGTALDHSMLIAKRPGTGIAPHEIDDILGRRVSRDLEADTVLHWDML